MGEGCWGDGVPAFSRWRSARRRRSQIASANNGTRCSIVLGENATPEAPARRPHAHPSCPSMPSRQKHRKPARRTRQEMQKRSVTGAHRAERSPVANAAQPSKKCANTVNQRQMKGPPSTGRAGALPGLLNGRRYHNTMHPPAAIKYR